MQTHQLFCRQERFYLQKRGWWLPSWHRLNRRPLSVHNISLDILNSPRWSIFAEIPIFSAVGEMGFSVILQLNTFALFSFFSKWNRKEHFKRVVKASFVTWHQREYKFSHRRTYWKIVGSVVTRNLPLRPAEQKKRGRMHWCRNASTSYTGRKIPFGMGRRYTVYSGAEIWGKPDSSLTARHSKRRFLWDLQEEHHSDSQGNICIITGLNAIFACL